MHGYYWVPRPTFVHVGSFDVVFHLGKLGKFWNTLTTCPGPGCLCTAPTHVGSGLEVSARHPAQCTVSFVAFLQKKLILSSCVELSLSGGRAAGSLPAVCGWEGLVLGVCVQHQSPWFPSCSGLCVSFSQNPLWELLAEAVFHPIET